MCKADVSYHLWPKFLWKWTKTGKLWYVKSNHLFKCDLSGMNLLCGFSTLYLILIKHWEMAKHTSFIYYCMYMEDESYRM